MADSRFGPQIGKLEGLIGAAEVAPIIEDLQAFEDALPACNLNKALTSLMRCTRSTKQLAKFARAGEEIDLAVTGLEDRMVNSVLEVAEGCLCKKPPPGKVRVKTVPIPKRTPSAPTASPKAA